MKLKLSKLIPLIGLTVILTGCATINRMSPCHVVKPKLPSIENTDGGMCLDRSDTEALAKYIHALRICAGQ